MGKNNRNIIDNVEVGRAYENFMDDQNALKKKRKKNPYEKKTPAYDDGKYLGDLSSQEIRDYQAEKNENKKTRKPRTKFKASGGRIHLKGGGICKKGINKKAFGKNS